MAHANLLFPSNRAANQLIAGVPAAVRAVIALNESRRLSHDGDVLITASDGWAPSNWSKREFARLVPAIRYTGSMDEGEAPAAKTQPIDAVELLCGATSLAPESALNRLSSDILIATGKPSDGLVSRHLNRPISRAISALALKIPGVTPIHATGLAGFTAILMAACLLFGGAWGLVAGALLFHAASVIDGVDGEIARATMRSSEFGAKLDTIVDGITNLAFLCLASLNLYWQGETQAATYGAVGLTLLATGLTALGLRSIAMGGPFTFDAVKNNFNARPSRLTNTLAAITSRDVYALVFALTFAFGFGKWMLLFFACAAAIWLVTVLTVLARTSSRQS